MFGNQHFENVRRMFADQFEPEGPDFLYRNSMKGAPIRVTQAERDAFVDSFNRRLRYLAWAIVPFTILLIGLLVVLVPDHPDSPAARVFVYVGIGCILIPFMVAYYRAWNAPARELDRRTPVGSARTREEVRRLMFSRMTYGQLGFAVLAALALLWNASNKGDVLHGWGVLWTVFAAALVLVAAVQAFWKWHSERS
jgi:MFS family permease